MRAELTALHAQLPRLGDPDTPADLTALLRMLYAVARRDLPLARLFEGHVDAVQIVTRYGDAATRRSLYGVLATGGVLGVWNAALPGDPLRIVDGRLHGAKSFASGAGIVTHAVAGADGDDGNRLVLIDMAASQAMIDRTWWRTIGMARSETHVVRWNGAAAESYRTVGAPGDYAREPWFSGGAIRFVACHAGGIAALFDRVRNHLNATARAADPHQAGRLAELYDAAAGAAAAVRDAAGDWGAPTFVDRVAAARMRVSAQAERALTIAQAAVGVSGMFDDHPLSSVLSDLTVYLRQPMPDAVRMRVGRAAADGTLSPAL